MIEQIGLKKLEYQYFLLVQQFLRTAHEQERAHVVTELQKTGELFLQTSKKCCNDKKHYWKMISNVLKETIQMMKDVSFQIASQAEQFAASAE